MDKFIIRNGIKIMKLSEGNSTSNLLSINNDGEIKIANPNLLDNIRTPIPDIHLLGLWRFDEYNNSDIYTTIDSSVHENHGSRMENPIPYELAVSGMGVNIINYEPIELSYVTGGTNISISVWRIGTPPINTDGAAMAGNVDSQPLIYIKQNGDIQETLTSTTMGTFPFDGKFHHIVMTFSGTVVQLYIDGHLIDTKPRTLLPSSGTIISTIGNILPLDRRTYPSGLIDEFRIYDRVITAQEVNWLFENPSGNNDSIPQADWESTDTSGKDYIKNKPTSLPPSPHTHDAGDITTGVILQEILPINQAVIVTIGQCYIVTNGTRFIYRTSTVCIYASPEDNGKEIIVVNDYNTNLSISVSGSDFYAKHGGGTRVKMTVIPRQFVGKFRVISNHFYQIL